MNKSQRLLQLMMLVNEMKRFTLREMAETLGVSRRTVMRDMVELSELGVPLYAEPGAAGGYRLLKEKLLPPVSLTENEATAIFFAAQSLRSYKRLPFAVETESALRKFRAILPSDARMRIDRLKRKLAFWVPTREPDAPCLEALLEAALEGHAVDIVYEGSEGAHRRRIRPSGLYAMNGLWYCPAYCLERGAARVFRADRVLACEPVPDDDSDAACAEADDGGAIEDFIMPPHGGGDPLQLAVALTREGVRRARSDVWLAAGLREEADGSGTVERAFDRSYVPWAASFFIGFGTAAEVLGPPELRDEIVRRMQALRRLYGDEEGAERRGAGGE